MPFLLLLQQHRVLPSHASSVIGKVSRDTGAAFDLLDQPLQLVFAPDLAPVLWQEGPDIEAVFPGLLHQGGSG